MTTNENLQAAFAGESQANRKYLAFAKKAEADGYPNVAKLFRAAAAAETIHAHLHLRTMGGIKDTAANLQAAMDGEKYEFTEMYPGFLAESQSEANKLATTAFTYAMESEKGHFDMYGKALESVKAGKDVEIEKIYVCDTCGYTVCGEPPDQCPICRARKEKFSEVV